MEINKIITLLKEDYIKKKSQHTEFVDFMENAKDPYIVLICCILSLRTNDKTTIGASKRMLALASDPKQMMNVEKSELEKAIYPVGFYKNKAEQIIELSKVIVEKYGGRVPCSIEELTKLKGVGRKTANLVMTKGFNVPAICVDTHVHRISNRLGYLKTKKPDETEMKLREILPQKYWIDFNTLLVTHGQNFCKPTHPDCQNCSIEKYCKKCI